MIPRASTGPIDELAATIVDIRSRLRTVELVAHRHLFDLDPTPWTAPALLNAWANIGPPDQDAQYRLVGDVVQIRGCIDAGTVGLVAFTLPVGFRPPALLSFAVISNNLLGVLNVTAAGDVIPAIGSNLSFHLNVQFSVTT